VAGEGWIGLDAPVPELWLAPAAVGLALASGLGMVAFEVDLPDYHFGWRQIISLFAGAAFVLAMLPPVAATVTGRWELPGTDYDKALAFMRTEADAEPFRSLWLGDAAVLPGVGFALEAPGVDDLGPDRTLTYLTSEQGVPSLAEHWPGTPGAATTQIEHAVRAAASGDTARLGALLAPMGVRYVVVPLAPAPYPQGEPRRYDPADLLATLEAQLDLDSVTVNPGVRVYRNAAWGPARALLPADTQIPGAELATTERTLPALAGAPVALPGGDHGTEHEGTIDRPGTVYLAESGGDAWSLEVDGEPAERTESLGWASAFRVDRAGEASLSFETPVGRWLALAGQVLLWIVAVAYLLRVRVVEDERDTLPVGGPVAPAHVVVTPNSTEPAGGRRRPARSVADLSPDAPTTSVRVLTGADADADADTEDAATEPGARGPAPAEHPTDPEPSDGTAPDGPQGDAPEVQPRDDDASAEPADLPTIAVPAITIEGPAPTGRGSRRRRGKRNR
jgi:hypothetical protein